MSKLHEFINFRMRELANEETALRHKLSQIEAERGQLHAAAQAAGITLQPIPSMGKTETQSAPRGGIHSRFRSPEPKTLPLSDLQAIEEEFAELLGRPTRRSIPEKTIKEAVVEVLTDARDGMTALDILAAINQRFETDYPRTSLSPQLSRLKAEGKLEREGMIWSLAKPSS